MPSHKDLNARLAFRLPDDVAASWRSAARAVGLSLSDWVRAQVRVDGQDTVITHKPSPQKLPKCQTALKNVQVTASNIDQG